MWGTRGWCAEQASRWHGAADVVGAHFKALLLRRLLLLLAGLEADCVASLHPLCYGNRAIAAAATLLPMYLCLLLVVGLEADGIASSHPLSIGRPIQKLSEIDNWFDDIEYSKGGSVLRMLRAWLNRANAPMLGLDFNSSDSSAGGSGGASQHARRLQQTLSQYLPDSPMSGTSSSSSRSEGSSSSNNSSWWLQHQKEHVAQARQPLLPTLLPAASSLESGSTAGASAEQPAVAADSRGSSSSSGDSSSSAAWWTKRAHIGVANANLVKGAAAAAAAGAAAGQESQLRVLPAGDGALATAGSEGVAGLAALGAKDPLIKGLRTYLQVRVSAVC
jgi:hypothetical protein